MLEILAKIDESNEIDEDFDKMTEFGNCTVTNNY